MSILEQQVANLVSGDKLFFPASRLTGEEVSREIFVSEEVLETVTPPFRGLQYRRHAEFRESLDAFTEGAELSVAEDPEDKDATASLARVHPVEDDLWDIRCIDPKPGIRAFGGFAKQNVLVVLTWEYREHITDFDAEVARCNEAWNYLFTSSPFHGANLNAYLSDNFRSV
jgi:hypothetical protein